MAYIVRQVTGAGEPLLMGHASSLIAAELLIPGGVFTADEDDDHPDHFDVLSNRGELFTVEPLKE